jgi:uncharacterized protein (DUF2062 family)
MSESEREGKNPFKASLDTKLLIKCVEKRVRAFTFTSHSLQDPLAIIGIAAIFLPFVLLGIAIALGLVDVNGGR